MSEIERATILWDMPVNSDKEMKDNRPDLIMTGKNERKCIMVDMSIPPDKNISIKEVEKLSKYKDLEIEVTKMWEMKTSTVPDVMETRGQVKKGFKTYLNQILMAALLSAAPAS